MHDWDRRLESGYNNFTLHLPPEPSGSDFVGAFLLRLFRYKIQTSLCPAERWREAADFCAREQQA